MMVIKGNQIFCKLSPNGQEICATTENLGSLMYNPNQKLIFLLVYYCFLLIVWSMCPSLQHINYYFDMFTCMI